jgi:membrane-associated phospholipid phosphatase
MRPVAHPRALVVVAATAAAVFAVYVVAVAVHSGPLPLDGMVRDWFATLSSADNRDLMRPVARLGAREVLIPLLLIGGAVLSLRRWTPGPVILLVGCYLGMALVVGPVKSLLHRPEPIDVAGDFDRSFPSGHAAQAILVYGMLGLLCLAGSPSPRSRAFATILPIVASAAVGFAVLFRDAHWLSDMVGGYAIGLVWTAGPVAYARLRAPWLLGVTPAGAPSGRTASGVPG